MRDVTRANIPRLCGAIWRTILNFYASQGVWVNCHRIHQKSLNFIYPFKFYSNFTNKNVSWLHFSWATQYVHVQTASCWWMKCVVLFVHFRVWAEVVCRWPIYTLCFCSLPESCLPSASCRCLATTAFSSRATDPHSVRWERCLYWIFIPVLIWSVLTVCFLAVGIFHLTYL